MLEHAPVTGTLLAASALTTAVAGRLFEDKVMTAAQLIGAKVPLDARSTAAAAALAHRLAALVPPLWQRIALETFPCGLCSTLSMTDTVCACVAFSHLRLLERRWGSGTALPFTLVCSLVGTLVTELVGVMTAQTPGLLSSSTHPGAMPIRVLPGGLSRLLSGNALIVPLTAILVRLLCEWPARSQADVLRRVPLPAALTRLFSLAPSPSGTTAEATACRVEFVITKTTALMLLLVLKLTVIPEVLFTLSPSGTSSAGAAAASMASRRQARVLVDLGLVTRMLLFLTGAVLGLWTAAPCSAINRLCVTPLRRVVCQPLLRLTRPLWQRVFGASRTVTHHTPPYLKAREAQAEAARQWQSAGLRGPATAGGDGVVVDGGRVTVQSLAHDDGGMGGLRRRARPAAGAAPTGSTSGSAAAPPSSSAASAGGDLFQVDESAVDQIRQLGLPVMDVEIRAALAATHGDVNGAVQLLLGSS